MGTGRGVQRGMPTCALQAPDKCASAENGTLPGSEQHEFPSIIGQSAEIREVCGLIGVVAQERCDGVDSGRKRDRQRGDRQCDPYAQPPPGGAFIKVNCAALSETLLEIELFGHVKGAFTGAIRDRRGRFKQAVGVRYSLTRSAACRFRGTPRWGVRQEQEFEPVGSSVTPSVNVRVIASTNVDLARAAGEGRFREDLYYRLHVFSIPLPPRRDRKHDIPLLARHLLQRYNRALGKDLQAIAPETPALLIEYD